MSTPIYDAITETVKLAKAGGEMHGRIAERAEILEIAKSISKKPTTHLKKLIEILEARTTLPGGNK